MLALAFKISWCSKCVAEVPGSGLYCQVCSSVCSRTAVPNLHPESYQSNVTGGMQSHCHFLFCGL